MEYKNKIEVKSIEFKDNLTSGQTQGGMELSLKDGRLMCKNGETEIPFTGMIEIVDEALEKLRNGLLFVMDDGITKTLQLKDGENVDAIGGGSGGGDISGSGSNGQVSYFTGNKTLSSITGTTVADNLIDFQNGVRLNTKLLKFESGSLIFDDRDVVQKVKGDDTINEGLQLNIPFLNDNSKTISSDNRFTFTIDECALEIGTQSSNYIRITPSTLLIDSTTLGETAIFTANGLSINEIIANDTLQRSSKDVITTENPQINRIPYFNSSNPHVANSSKLTFNLDTLSTEKIISTISISTPSLNATKVLQRNSKNVVTTSGTTSNTRIPYYTSANQVTDSAGLSWDNSNNLLLITDGTYTQKIFPNKTNIYKNSTKTLEISSDESFNMTFGLDSTKTPIGNNKTKNSLVFLNCIADRDNSISRSIDDTTFPTTDKIGVKTLNKSKTSEISFFGDNVTTAQAFFSLQTCNRTILIVEINMTLFISNGGGVCDYNASIYQKYGFYVDSDGNVTQMTLNESLTSCTIKNTPKNVITEVFQTVSPKDFTGIDTDISQTFEIKFLPLGTTITRIDGIAHIVESRF